jgi:hypothetical protein
MNYHDELDVKLDSLDAMIDRGRLRFIKELAASS